MEAVAVKAAKEEKEAADEAKRQQELSNWRKDKTALRELGN